MNNRMTVLEVRRRIAAIEKDAKFESGRWDDEKAHMLEDKLMMDVLDTIAANKIPRATMQALAQESLQVRSLPFARHCA